MSNPNIVVESAHRILVYPTNDRAKDVANVQQAVDDIAPGGLVVLKRSARDTNALTPFAFGMDGVVEVTRDVTLEGEVSSQAAGGWIETGTTIAGGRQMMCGGKFVDGNWQLTPISIVIRNIRFEGFHAGAISIVAAKGNSAISGCSFVNYHVGQTVKGGITGAFPFVVDGDQPDSVTGRLTITRNLFGLPPADANLPNNVLHVSNCDLELEISHNKIEDIYWIGIAVYGNRGRTRIQHNDITKTLSRAREGAGIMLGIRIAAIFRPWAYEGPADISHNRIRIGSANSWGIAVMLYPPTQFHPAPVGAAAHPGVTVSDNVILMLNDNQQAALACLGASSGTEWKHNFVCGRAKYGIRVSREVPEFAMPAEEGAEPSRNKFFENHFEGGEQKDPIDGEKKPFAPFVASVAQAFIDTTADQVDLAGNKFGTVAGANPAFPQIAVAGVWCKGHTSTIKRNDFSASALGGWQSPSHVGCIYLDALSHDNTVHQGIVYPAGTDGASQVYDAAGLVGHNSVPAAVGQPH